MRRLPVALLAIGCAGGAPARGQVASDRAPAYAGDRSPHAVRRVAVAPGVALEVLDWGGAGPTLVFLTGMTHSAHVYDAFAPQFTDAFRVIAITRRGTGASSWPAAGYATDTLAQDVVAVLDSLHVARANVAAHSFGGSELTWLAAHHPERVARLVYIDAGYDQAEAWRDSAFVNTPAPQPPRAPYEDGRVGAVLLRMGRVFGPGLPESDVRATYQVDDSSRVGAYLGVDGLAEKLIAGTRSAEYGRVRAPTLALYGVMPTVQVRFPWWNALDSAGRAAATRRFAVEAPMLARQRSRLRREVAGSRVVEIEGGRHYLFLTHGPEVAHEMRAFLAER